jgi:hypothetical protein
MAHDEKAWADLRTWSDGLLTAAIWSLEEELARWRNQPERQAEVRLRIAAVEAEQDRRADPPRKIIIDIEL